MSALKPCPFCGELPQRDDDGWMHKGNGNCWVGTLFIMEGKDSEDWNRRADIPWLPEVLVEPGKQAIYLYDEVAAFSVLRDIVAALEQIGGDVK